MATPSIADLEQLTSEDRIRLFSELYASLSPMAKDKLARTYPEIFDGLRGIWLATGSPAPTAREAPASPPAAPDFSLLDRLPVGGARYEQLAPMVRHALAQSDPERFERLRADWKRRGEPPCAVDLDAPGSGSGFKLISEAELGRRLPQR